MSVADRAEASGLGEGMEAGVLARFGGWLAGACERYFPDAFVFALLAVLVAFLAGLTLGEKPLALTTAFGKGFWNLVPFTMQMVMVIVGGYTVAVSPPVHRLIRAVAGVPKSPRAAVALVALFAMLASLLSWGFSLIFSGLLVREISSRVRGVDFRALGAAAYLGLGSIWALGLSSSAALMMATRDALPPEILRVSGVIPLSGTLFLWQNLLLIGVLVPVAVSVAAFSCPPGARARTAEDLGVRFDPPSATCGAPSTPGERLEYSSLLGVAVALLGMAWLVTRFAEKGGLAALDLNTYNATFIFLALLLHRRPRSFLNAVAGAIPATGGVIIQFPFYGGVLGIITAGAISGTLASAFTAASTRHSFPLLVAAYSAVLGLFVPSGGGKWVIEAPYVLTAATAHGINHGWVVQIYNAAEALPNLINPFWMLPLMGILNVRARELAGFSILQLLVNLPLVFLLCWALSYTF